MYIYVYVCIYKVCVICEGILVHHT